MRSLKKRSALKNEDPLIAVKTMLSVNGPPSSELAHKQTRLNLFQHLSLQEPFLTTHFHNPIFITRS